MGLFTRKPSALDTVAAQLAAMNELVTGVVNQNNYLQQQIALQNNFRALGGFLKSDTNNQIGYITNGYQLSAAVYSIVSFIAQKATAIPLKCYEIKADKELKAYEESLRYPRTPENVFKSYRLRTKALAEVQDDDPIQMLIDRPNNQESTSLFYQENIIFRLLTGNAYWYAPSIDKGPDISKVSQLYTMPSPFVLLYVTNYFPQQVIGYELIINGVKLLETKEVIHSRYANPYWSVDGQQLYGMSPLKAGARTLKRANDSETAAIAQLENGGPAVIISNKSISSDDFGIEQIGKSKEQFKREYSGVVNKAKVKMMAGEIDVHQLGITPVELDLIAGEHWNFAQICNLYHISKILFNDDASSTESNVKEMRKDSYTSAIIPERQAQADMFNTHIVPAYNIKGKRYRVELDLSGIEELQTDKVALATWMSLFPWATPNEKREMLDFGKSPDTNMDKIYVPSGIMPLEDASIQVDNIPNPETNVVP